MPTAQWNHVNNLGAFKSGRRLLLSAHDRNFMPTAKREVVQDDFTRTARLSTRPVALVFTLGMNLRAWSRALLSFMQRRSMTAVEISSGRDILTMQSANLHLIALVTTRESLMAYHLTSAKGLEFGRLKDLLDLVSMSRTTDLQEWSDAVFGDEEIATMYHQQRHDLEADNDTIKRRTTAQTRETGW